MKVERAGELFHGKEGFNCAQAILKTFQNDFNIDEEQIIEAALKGGGRAEEGICGALYGARCLLLEDNDLNGITRVFNERAGSIYCHEIRKGKKLSCRECVKLSASKVAELLDSD